MTGPQRLSELQQRLATMPEAEAALRLDVYNRMVAGGASTAFAGVCAFGCSSDKLAAFAAEVKQKQTSQEETR